MSEVISVHKSENHTFSKTSESSIMLVTGQGVEGDAHKGVKVKHRSRVRADPSQPNLRQVHLIHCELIDELQQQGFKVAPGSMGENITTKGIDLLNLPTDSILHIGHQVELKVTGLRNPCGQLDKFQKGLTAAVLGRDGQGKVIRKAGIMSIVITGGEIAPGDSIKTILPKKPYLALEPV